MDQHTANAGSRTPPAGRLAAAAFLAVVLAAPFAEVGWSIAHDERPQILRAFSDVARRTDAQRIEFEESLHDGSILTHTLLPHYQQWMTRLFGFGNRKVAIGRDDWLFLREDLDFAYGPGCFAPHRGGAAAVAVIVDFKKQLEARGIELLVVPVSGKDLSDPESFSSRTSAIAPAPNGQLDDLFALLEQNHVEAVRVDALVAELRATEPGRPRYLARDVHWTPATMRFIAHQVAERAFPLLGARPEDDGRLALAPPQPIKGEGDLVRMLGLAHPESAYPAMELSIEPVVDTKSGRPVAAERGSEILLLGDSFAKVFGDPALGLGSNAGFAERLAFEFKQPIDVIALAGGATTAVRATLAQSAERLDGKRLVIWEFSARFLAHAPDEWQRVELPALAPSTGETTQPVEVIGEIAAVTRIPDSFDYAFCLAIYEYKVVRTISGDPHGERVWVAFPAIVDRKSTPARSFEVGARHRLKLEPIARHYDLDATSWIDDTHAKAPIRYAVEWEAEPPR